MSLQPGLKPIEVPLFPAALLPVQDSEPDMQALERLRAEAKILK